MWSLPLRVCARRRAIGRDSRRHTSHEHAAQRQVPRSPRGPRSHPDCVSPMVAANNGYCACGCMVRTRKRGLDGKRPGQQ